MFSLPFGVGLLEFNVKCARLLLLLLLIHGDIVCPKSLRHLGEKLEVQVSDQVGTVLRSEDCVAFNGLSRTDIWWYI